MKSSKPDSGLRWYGPMSISRKASLDTAIGPTVEFSPWGRRTTGVGADALFALESALERFTDKDNPTYALRLNNVVPDLYPGDTYIERRL